MKFNPYYGEINWYVCSHFLLKDAAEMFKLTIDYLDIIFVDLDDSEFYLEYLI